MMLQEWRSGPWDGLSHSTQVRPRNSRYPQEGCLTAQHRPNMFSSSELGSAWPGSCKCSYTTCFYYLCVLLESPVKSQVLQFQGRKWKSQGVKGEIALGKPCLQGRQGSWLLDRRESESWDKVRAISSHPPILCRDTATSHSFEISRS